MSKRREINLSGLIAKKGEATPAFSTLRSDLISITVKLNQAQYEKLKSYGARNRLTNQDIITRLLDEKLSNEM